jgi:hypothetical protein
MVSRMEQTTKETMKGILIYAFNNKSINYFRQAVWCANRVNKYLNLPVTIVTDDESIGNTKHTHNIIISRAESGGYRVFNPGIDSSADVWYNGNRFQSYELSPYDQTIVLDSDYIVCSDQLLTLFDTTIEVTAMKHVYDITNRDQFLPYKSISDGRGLHHYWATVLYFRKGQTSQDFFNLLTMIKENYIHYSNLYSFRTTPFRNDFAVSIALNTIYGHIPDAIPVIPWRMANVFSDVEISTDDQEIFNLGYRVENKYRTVQVTGQDFHFMNKNSLAKLYEN